MNDELRRFDGHMERARGVAPKTRRITLRIVQELLRERFHDRPVVMYAIAPEHVRRFFARMSKRCRAPLSAGALVAALRGYFRFREMAGDRMHGLLRKTMAREIRAWLRRNASPRGDAALLPNRSGQPMTRSNAEQQLDLAVQRATSQQSSLAKKRISPHIIRHATAMHMLQSGVPFNVIALCLGHESPNTTMRWYRPAEPLLTFLQQL